MHYLVFGINFQIYSVSLASLVSTYLFSHLSSHLIIFATLSIHHSFTPSSKPTFSTNPSHLNRLLNRFRSFQ